MSLVGVALHDVTRTFGTVPAIDRVTLEIATGELIAVLGPSGSGKTTLLRIVAGLERPDAGRVLIDGRDVTALPVRERPIGMVFQSYALFPNLTVQANVGFPLRMRRWNRERSEGRVDELLRLVRLDEHAHRYPHEISGGQQQRAALARALAPDPAVLLLDEPLSALDALVRTRLRDEIRRIQQQVGTTAIYVTHDQSEAMAIADRVVVMNAGRIEQLARPIELYDAPCTPFSAAFVGSRNAVELPVVDGRISLGQAFTADAPTDTGPTSLAFFRPEDVILGLEGQPAQIDLKVFLGASTRLHLSAPLEERVIQLYADVPSRLASALAVGDPVAIRVDPGNVRTFPG